MSEEQATSTETCRHERMKTFCPDCGAKHPLLTACPCCYMAVDKADRFCAWCGTVRSE